MCFKSKDFRCLFGICHNLMCLCVQKDSEIHEAVRAKLIKVQLSFGDPFEQVCGEGFFT